MALLPDAAQAGNGSVAGLWLAGTAPARGLVARAEPRRAGFDYLPPGTLLALLADRPKVVADGAMAGGSASSPKTDAKSGMDQPEHMLVEGTQTLFEKTLMESGEINAFFSDPERHEEELQVTRLRLRGDAFLREGSGTDFDFNVRGRYVLPQTDSRLVLLLSGDFDRALGPEDNPQQSDVKSLLEPDDEEEDGVLALQGFLKATEKLNISIQAGGRLRGGQPVAFIGPRYRQTFEVGKWATRVLLQTRWFTDEGFSVRGLVDFERVLNERLFLRITPRADWEEEADGARYGLDFDLTQRFSGPEHRLRYQIFTRAETEPDHVATQITFRLNYRRKTPWDWLYVEVAPEVTFLEDRNYEPTPGLFIRADVILGPFGFRI